MTVKIVIPSLLTRFTNGKDACDVAASSVDDAMTVLVSLYPELGHHLFNEAGTLRGYLQLFKNDDNIRELQGVQTSLQDGDELTLIAALAGG